MHYQGGWTAESVASVFSTFICRSSTISHLVPDKGSNLQYRDNNVERKSSQSILCFLLSNYEEIFEDTNCDAILRGIKEQEALKTE